MKRSIEVRSCVPVKFRVKVKSTLSPTSYFCDFKLLKDVSSFVVVSFCWAMSILPFTVNSPLMAANILNPCEKRRCHNHIHKNTPLCHLPNLCHFFLLCLFNYYKKIDEYKLYAYLFRFVCSVLFGIAWLGLFSFCLHFVNVELVVIKNGDAVIPIISERIFYQHFVLMLSMLHIIWDRQPVWRTKS